jgi:hypothetical protein
LEVAVYNQPDWSSLTLPELLDKALEFGNKAYSRTMSTFAFLERATETSPKHTDLTDEIVGLADRAQQVNKLLANLNRDITHLQQEFPLPVQRDG